MVRGLYAVEHDEWLPEDKARSIGFNHPYEPEIPDYVRPLLGRPSHGHTPQCFSYTFTSMKAELKEKWDQPDLHLWVLFLWETYVIHIAFHDPTCDCKTCVEPG